MGLRRLLTGAVAVAGLSFALGAAVARPSTGNEIDQAIYNVFGPEGTYRFKDEKAERDFRALAYESLDWYEDKTEEQYTGAVRAMARSMDCPYRHSPMEITWREVGDARRRLADTYRIAEKRME